MTTTACDRCRRTIWDVKHGDEDGDVCEHCGRIYEVDADADAIDVDVVIEFGPRIKSEVGDVRLRGYWRWPRGLEHMRRSMDT